MVVPTAVQSVTVSPATAQLTVGQKQQFTVNVLPATATNKSVTWTASPQSAGTIDGNGLFTAAAAGTATVTATSVATPTVLGTASATITPPPAAVPFIRASIFSVVGGGQNFFGDLQQVDVCNDSGCAAPITNATVLVDGNPLTYSAAKMKYTGNFTVNPGRTFPVKVTAAGIDYSASLTQFTSFGSATSPVAGSNWSGGQASTAIWTLGSPTTNASNLFGVVNGSGQLAYPSGSRLLELPITTTTYTVPAGWTSIPGDYHVLNGIGTPGMGNGSGSGVPIPNAAAGSAAYVAGFSFTLIHVF